MTYGSSDRGGAEPIWVVLHSAEGIRKAVDLRAFLDDNPQASAHSAIDSIAIIPMVPRARASWTLGSGNRLSMNTEMCVFAEMTREQWLATGTITFYNQGLKRNVTVDNPRQIIRNAAKWAREECDYWDIPKRFLTIEECARGMSGIIDHRTYNKAYNAGDHWDVGYNFPVDVFMADVLEKVSEVDVLTPNDGNVRWAAADPTKGTNPDGSAKYVETNAVATWMGSAAFHAIAAWKAVEALAKVIDAERLANAEFRQNVLKRLDAAPGGPDEIEDKAEAIAVLVDQKLAARLKD